LAGRGDPPRKAARPAGVGAERQVPRAAYQIAHHVRLRQQALHIVAGQECVARHRGDLPISGRNPAKFAAMCDARHITAQFVVVRFGSTEQMEGSMQHNAIAAQSWQRELDDTASQSFEIVTLFSLLGLVASVAVLLTSSPQTVATITAALMI
jgi:hypothetical protein